MSNQMKILYLTLCRGLPGSGKTSWAKQQVRKSFGSTVRVSKDDLRVAFHVSDVITGADKDKEEKLITKIQHETIRAFFVAKKNVIVDDVNLSLRVIEDFYRLAQEFDGAVQLRFQDFPVSVKECVFRDNARAEKGERSVGEQVIKDISKRYLHGGSDLPELPSKYYSWVERIDPLKQDKSLPSAWIVDLDGTLAMMSVGGRGPYDFDRVDEDEPVEHAVELVRNLHDAGHKIVVVSGRSSSCKNLTQEWLDAFDVPYDVLLMRAEDDDRSDHIIKGEIYNEHIAGKFFVAGCLDDRKKVVDMWRSKGLFVAQVSPGLF